MQDVVTHWLDLLWLGWAAMASVGFFYLLRRWRALKVANADLNARLETLAGDTAAQLGAERQRCELLVTRLIDSAGAGYLDWEVASGSARLGGAWASMLGYVAGRDHGLGASPGAADRLTAGMWLELSHPRDRRRVQRLLRELAAGERERAHGELRLRSVRGYWHWVQIDAQVVERDAAGKPARVLATQVDINRSKRSEHLLCAERRLFASGPVIVITFDALPPYRLHRVSRNFEATFGDPAKPLERFLHPDDVDRLAGAARKILGHPGVQTQCEVRLARPDGHWSWCLLRVIADRPQEGSLLRAYLVDINPLKEAESNAVIQNAAQQEMVRKMAGTQRFLTTLQQLTELLQLCDSEDESRLIIEQAGVQLFPGWSGALTFADDEGVMTVAANWGKPFTPPHTEEADCWAVRRGRLHQHNAETSASTLSPLCGHLGGHAGGQSLPVGVQHAICAPLLKSFDRPGALHLITCDKLGEEALKTAAWGAENLANALKLSLGNLRLRTSLREQAVRDVMTELYNRRYFDESIGRELSRSQRTGDDLTLAIMDIDHFKTFNDSFGHEAGDQVLRTVAERMRHFVRAYDIACRVGGEELAIIMPRMRKDEACPRLDRLREEIGACALSHNGMPLPSITVSIGVADLSSGTADDLQRRADIALYAAKHGGRNRVVCWETDLEAASFGAFGQGRAEAERRRG